MAKRNPPPGKLESSGEPLTHNPFAVLKQAVGASAVPPDAHPAGRAEARATPLAGDEVTLQEESKGRGGKTVTRITGVATAHLEALSSRLKHDLGCGGIVDGRDLLLLGSLQERAAEWLRRAGVRRVVVGHGSSVATPTVTHAGAVTERADIRRGQCVAIVLKADQPTGALSEGVVRDILTNSRHHPHGIKVRLESGLVGRVKKILD